MVDVTTKSIETLVNAYCDYVKSPTAKLLNQLASGISKQLTAVGGGAWHLPDDKEHYRKSFFEGLTRLCWHFSAKKEHAADAATAYRDLVDKNYNLYYHMSVTDKSIFRAECRQVTDTLQDWTAITKELVPRRKICKAALEVTTGMYDQSSKEVEASTKLWDGRV